MYASSCACQCSPVQVCACVCGSVSVCAYKNVSCFDVVLLQLLANQEAVSEFASQQEASLERLRQTVLEACSQQVGGSLNEAPLKMHVTSHLPLLDPLVTLTYPVHSLCCVHTHIHTTTHTHTHNRVPW